MKTAEEFYDMKDSNGKPMSFNEKMIEFAKLHVAEALKQAGEKFDGEYNKYAVLTAYPLENIK